MRAQLLSAMLLLTCAQGAQAKDPAWLELHQSSSSTTYVAPSSLTRNGEVTSVQYLQGFHAEFRPGVYNARLSSDIKCATNQFRLTNIVEYDAAGKEVGRIPGVGAWTTINSLSSMAAVKQYACTGVGGKPVANPFTHVEARRTKAK